MLSCSRYLLTDIVWRDTQCRAVSLRQLSPLFAALRVHTDSKIVIRDCAEVDYGDFCQQFEPKSPDVTAVSDQQQQSKLEVCVSTCRWSSCNKLPAVE